MGVDLHRIGTGISSGKSRNGFGNIVSFPAGAGFPAAGTILSTQYLLKNVGDGGSYVTDNDGVQHDNAMHTVYEKADGSGGSYFDWANSVFGNYITGNFYNASGTTYVYVSGVQYVSGSYSNTYDHDGNGGIAQVGDSSYTAYGEFIVNLGSHQSEINTPGGDFTYFSYSDGDAYHDGFGGYYLIVNNEYNAQNGDYIGNDGTYDYYYDGSGGYYTT